MNNSERVTIAVITHNGRDVIEDCLKAVEQQSFPFSHIVVIDVASDDGTTELVRSDFPTSRLTRLDKNNGPNPARNTALREAETPYVLLVDDDAAPEQDCLAMLMAAAEQRPNGGVWVPRVVYFDNPDVVQHQGGQFHFVGEAMLNDVDLRADEAAKEIKQVTVGTGICMLVSKSSWEAVGGFDDDYFFGRTDSEFTHRVALAGFGVYAVPAAVCRHKVKARAFGKLYYQIRNRWYFTLSAYSTRTLIVLAPAIVAHELMLAIFLLFKGEIFTHIRALISVAKSRRMIMEKRSRIQDLRRVPDRALLDAGGIMVRSGRARPIDRSSTQKRRRRRVPGVLVGRSKSAGVR